MCIRDRYRTGLRQLEAADARISDLRQDLIEQRKMIDEQKNNQLLRTHETLKDEVQSVWKKKYEKCEAQIRVGQKLIDDLSDEKLEGRVERVVARIQRATFTGKGDKDKVPAVYREYVERIAGALQPLLAALGRVGVRHALEGEALVRHGRGHERDAEDDGVELVARAQHRPELALEQIVVLVRAAARRVDEVHALAQLVLLEQPHGPAHLGRREGRAVQPPAERRHVHGQRGLAEAALPRGERLRSVGRAPRRGRAAAVRSDRNTPPQTKLRRRLSIIRIIIIIRIKIKA